MPVIKIWKFYSLFYNGLKSRLVLVTFVAVLQACFIVPVAMFIRHIFDQLIPKKELNGLLFYGLIILGFYLASNLLVLFNRYQALKVTKNAIQRLRDELLNKIFKLSRSYYTQTDRQKLHAIIVQDTERLDIVSNAFFATFIPSALLSVLLAMVLIYLNFSLFFILIVLSPFLYLAGKILGRRFHHEIKNFHHKFESFSGGVSFILRMLDLTFLQTAEESELKRQKSHHLNLRETSRKMAWLGTAYSVTQTLIMIITTVTILILGGRAVIAHQITMGDLLAFFFAFGLMREHLQNVLHFLPEMIAGQHSLKKLYDVFLIPDELPYAGKHKIVFNGNVSLENINFAYNKTLVLKNISLHLQPGKIYGLVGPNGSGKSTILNLITGLYKPQSGKITAENFSYEEIDIPELRRHIGVVLQDPMLFPGSIHENITYGDMSYSRKNIEDAVAMATADQFINEFDSLYQTPIGENGVLLSGGQSQKIALARALIRKPALLILDEPTNHLDSASIEKMIKNIMEQMKSVTILIVSHDERVIKNCDSVFFLNEGVLTKEKSFGFH